MINVSRFGELLARSLMALIFLIAGVRKILSYGMTLGYFASLGVPVPDVVLPLVIALEIGGGIALISGWRLQMVAAAMGLFTLGAALFGHAFWNSSPEQFTGQLNNFLKNVAMVGGFLLLLLRPSRTASKQTSSAGPSQLDRAV